MWPACCARSPMRATPRSSAARCRGAMIAAGGSRSSTPGNRRRAALSSPPTMRWRAPPACMTRCSTRGRSSPCSRSTRRCTKCATSSGTARTGPAFPSIACSRSPSERTGGPLDQISTRRRTAAVSEEGQRIAAVWPGQPYPRGATWDGEGVNFSLFSAAAEKVELCLFDPTGRHEVQRIALRERTDEIWHCYLPEARPGLLYGYRVHGPYRPEQGLRFNPNKLLIEPYAKRLEGALVWSDAHFGYRLGSPKADLSFDKRDSAAGTPKCRVTDSAFTWGDDRPPRVPWHDTVIYEAHVRGQTM